MNEENQTPDFFEERDVFGQPKPKIPTSSFIDTNPIVDKEFNYANFGERLLAYLIDILILFIPVYIARGSVFDNYSFAATGLNQKLFELALWTLYFGQTESSEKQASFGKRICKIKVVDLNGNRLSFLRASARFLAMGISFIALGLGIIAILINSKRQGWHDALAGCFVIKENNNAA